jgi:hypothetical protein
MPQAHVKFRESLGEVTLFLTLDEGFVEKDKWGSNSAITLCSKFENSQALWFLMRLVASNLSANCSTLINLSNAYVFKSLAFF